ncbi:MAG TPA: hypothetical protein VGE07_30965 [Herpetosiphonaceae bacterium]
MSDADELRRLAARAFAGFERTDPEREPDGHAAAWEAALVELRDVFAASFGAGEIARRLRIPADYDLFMRTVGGGFFRNAGPGMGISRPEMVARDTADAFDLFYAGEDAEPEDSGLWLTVGWWGDKHDYLLCCDAGHPRFGSLIDGHDSHPWLNGVDCGGCRRRAPSFAAFLRDLAG